MIRIRRIANYSFQIINQNTYANSNYLKTTLSLFGTFKSNPINQTNLNYFKYQKMAQQNVLLDYSKITTQQLQNVRVNYVNKHDQIVKNILSIPDAQLTWNNVVQPFITLDNQSVDSTVLEMKDFYTEASIRDKATEVSTQFSKWGIEQSMRQDIYSKYKHYFDNQFLKQKQALTPEQVVYLTDKMISYKMKGMDLPHQKFERLKEIKKIISDLQSQFRQNSGNENYSEFISADQLKGLPQKFIKERTQQDSTVKITLKYPDYVPIMQYAQNRELRKRISTLFKSRCIKQNTPLIEQVFDLRAEIASIFAFEHYSDYKLQKNMADSTQKVSKFLTELLTQVKPLLRKDLQTLGELAKADGIEKLQPYDVTYYSRIFVEKTCQFDKEQLKKYFPVERVVSGTFDMYQRLLGFRFEKLQGQENTFWHQSVQLYQVNDSQSGDKVGYFYLDLFPREGKYGHAACFPFITKSSQTLPVATMACNFGKGNLTFDEVETFFHQFGHVMHHLSSQSSIKDTASFSCEHDFVETPSQMFEEWCYSEEPLSMLSQGLPHEMVEKLNQSRKLLQGYHYARQLLFGQFDMFVHSAGYKAKGLNPKQLFDHFHKQILELDPLENTSQPANFGHLLGGYDAGYYGYAWSLVYAKDLFGQFKQKGLLNSQLGMKLRKQVLSQGSMRKSMESIKVFLGREPSNEEFIKSIC